MSPLPPPPPVASIRSHSVLYLVLGITGGVALFAGRAIAPAAADVVTTTEIQNGMRTD